MMSVRFIVAAALVVACSETSDNAAAGPAGPPATEGRATEGMAPKATAEEYRPEPEEAALDLEGQGAEELPARDPVDGNVASPPPETAAAAQPGDDEDSGVVIAPSAGPVGDAAEKPKVVSRTTVLEDGKNVSQRTARRGRLDLGGEADKLEVVDEVVLLEKAEGKKKQAEKERAGFRQETAQEQSDEWAEGEKSGLPVPRGYLAERPESFIPDTCYVENTYLGGNAAYLEQLRRLDEALAPYGNPHRLAAPPPRDLDPPESAGMALSAALSTRWFEQPQRVFLQVGLRGSERYGWRRPPLEMVLVVDAAALQDGPEAAVSAVRALLRQLGPKDSLAIVTAGEPPRVLADLSRLRHLRTEILPQLDAFARAPAVGPRPLELALERAGELLQRAALDRSTLPGTQTVLVLTRGADAARLDVARRQAHRLTVQGVVTSVIQLGEGGAWWSVANAGHGNYHQAAAEAEEGAIGHAVAEELESLARVVARLLRLNVRLAPGVKAVRVLGSRVLDQETVRRVKAREVATDRQLSRSLGIVADRGEDDDGIQTVIPYFYGGDAHVVVLELWVEKPGKVADVTLRYKDMVAVDNATARTAVFLRNVPREPTGEQLAVAEALPSFTLAATLSTAARHVESGHLAAATRTLAAASAPTPTDARLLRELTTLVTQAAPHDPTTVAAALRLAARRKVGGTPR